MGGAKASVDNNNIFSFVKENIRVSDFVRTLPQLSVKLKSQGRGQFRCNNVIAGGSNPSAMLIDDETGYFKIFSHGGEGGDVITLYQNTLGKGLEPWESALGLAQHMGLDVPEELKERSGGGGISKSKLTDAMDELSWHLHEYLMGSRNSDAAMAREYLRSRKASKSLVRDWRLGLFPESEKKCLEIMRKCTDSMSVFAECGLLKGKSRDFVVMQGRLCSPIFSVDGKCVSFSSRTIPGIHCMMDDSKYINTSSTEIYNKSATLYGQHLIREKRPDSVIVCEGNFDVIALNAMADEHTVAVATCGTAFTASHSALLKKHRVKDVTIMFDTDDAGSKAASKLVWLYNEFDNVYLGETIGFKDPWEMLEQDRDLSDCVIGDFFPSVTRIAYSNMDKTSFEDWIKDSYVSLNFSEDKFDLISAIENIAGLSRRKINLIINSLGNRRTINQGGDEEEDYFSRPATSLITGFLAMDKKTRATVAFPMYTSKKEKIMDLLGCDSDDDERAINISLGIGAKSSNRLSSKVFSLAPDTKDADDVMRTMAQTLALHIIRAWKSEGIPERCSGYVNPISMIAYGISGADGKMQASFVFDVACVA